MCYSSGSGNFTASSQRRRAMSELEAKKAPTDKQSQPQITKADMLAFRNRLVDFENESTTEVERLRRKESLNKGEVVQATIMLA